MMEESWKTSTTPQPSTPTAGLGERPERSSTAETKETEPFAQAASEIAELMQRFVEEVGAAKRDAQVAADSARTAHADAERVRLEAIKHRADAEAEAIRLVDGARAEADRSVRRQRRGPPPRIVSTRGIADDLERAQEILGTAIDRVGDVKEPTASEYVALMPYLPGEAEAQS